jgi:DNA polymerase-3 subunit alpha
VGQAPVEEIIRGREEAADRTNGHFSSLNYFVRRVDLRKVGKRPLECLIKVGGLDQLGERGSLLASIDQIVMVSTSYFKAKEMGQMDLFGGMLVEETPLLVLQTQTRMSKKDQLDWEKELLGLYISDHPLNAYLRQVENKISHNSNALMETDENDKVTVGGVVNRLRPIRTKKDQMMAL